ncbi:MAG TPA: sialidase family protein [Rhizomicrobium sp.]
MRKSDGISAISAAAFLLFAGVSHAQMAHNGNVNVSQKANYQNECAIVKKPSSNTQLFAACNNSTGGLFAARSTDLGNTWSSPWNANKTIADGTPGLGAAACCDPTLAWDSFGNLFVTYVDGTLQNIVTLLSTDGGLTFTTVATFGPASVDQPTVAVGPGTAPGTGQVWVVWNQSGAMVARGATVTGPGAVGAFNPIQNIPGTNNCSYGDIIVAPNGKVVQTCESPDYASGPANILVNTDPDGTGPSNFGAAVTATPTNVGGLDFITPQSVRSVDAEAGLAYDRNPSSPHFGRLYLVYTDSPAVGSNDTDIRVRFSDTDGATWSAFTTASDDLSGRSQFLPRIASNPQSGNVGVCWHDSRNSPSDTSMEEFCSIATPLGATPAFLANGQVGDGLSTGTGSNPPVVGQYDIQFGDYSGLDYNFTPGIGQIGGLHPIWADDSNLSGGAPGVTDSNPDGTSRYDAYTDKVTGGPAANEGDPHITTVDQKHYNFQSAGEFVALRDYGGLEIQTRQSPVSTASGWYDGYTGLTTCVSLNSAVAVRLGARRVTYQRGPGGGPNSNPMELRVDGALTTLPAGGLTFGADGHIVKASSGDGIEIDFADGTTLVATGWWWGAPQNAWVLNVDVYHSPGLVGIMGAMAQGSWLPLLSNGSSVGPMPGAMHQRFVTLNQTYADSWRITDKTSLFDYAPGTSTATFTNKSWPAESGSCVVPKIPPAKPMDPQKAQELCREIEDKNRHIDCVFDATATGEVGFVEAYKVAEALKAGGTTIGLTLSRPMANRLNRVAGPIVTATVSRLAGAGGAPGGAVQFMVDRKDVGDPVRLDGAGRATWNSASIPPGGRVVSARFIPDKESSLLPSTSAELRLSMEGLR